MHHNYPCCHIAVRDSAGREFVFAFGDNHDRDSGSLEVFVTLTIQAQELLWYELITSDGNLYFYVLLYNLF